GGHVGEGNLESARAPANLDQGVAAASEEAHCRRIDGRGRQWKREQGVWINSNDDCGTTLCRSAPTCRRTLRCAFRNRYEAPVRCRRLAASSACRCGWLRASPALRQHWRSLSW